MIALSITKADGSPLATLVNWANHPETLGSKNTLLTADYSATLYSTLEEKLGGVAVFMNGAVGGMQSPLGSKLPGLKDNTFEKAGFIGRRVAELAAGAVQAAHPVEIDATYFVERMVDIPLANPGFQLAAKADLYKGRKPMNSDGPRRRL